MTPWQTQNTKPSGKLDLTTPWRLINRRVKPTSRNRGNYQTVGSNRSHGTVATTKPSGSNRPHGTVATTKPSGSNRPHGTVATTKPSGSNRPHGTVATTKPSGSNRPHGTVAIPVLYNISTESNLRYNMVHHLITSNTMSLLTCTFSNVTVS